jgi:hypothetical protein
MWVDSVKMNLRQGGVVWTGLVWLGKPGGKRPLGRPRRRWVDNIRMYFGDVGWGGVDWIGLARKETTRKTKT